MEDKKIVLNKWQAKVWFEKARFLVLACGRRSGKTYFSALKILDFVQKNPNSIVNYIAPYQNQARNIMWELMKQLTPQHWIEKTNENELKINLTNGSIIQLKGADLKPDRLRGIRIDFLVLDEVAYFKNWKTVWVDVLRPTLIDSKGKAIFISNPNGYNHFYDIYQKGLKEEDEYKSYHFTTYDNNHLEKEELDALSKEYQYDQDAYQQEIMAEFIRFSGMVFSGFSRHKHFIPPIEFPKGTNYYRGIDFGFRNETAVVFLAVTPDNKVYLYDIIYKTQVLTPELAVLIKQKSVDKFFNGTWADSAQMSDIAELRKYGISINPVSKSVYKTSTKSESFVMYKTRKLQQLISADKFYIFNHLDDALFEFENYKFKEVYQNGTKQEIPLKVKDHIIDATSYVVINLPEYYEPSLTKPEGLKNEIPRWAYNPPKWSGLKHVKNYDDWN